MNSKPYVAGKAKWNYIGIDADPPLGKTIHILTYGGVSIKGVWMAGNGYRAWSPLIVTDKEKERAQAALIADGKLKL